MKTQLDLYLSAHAAAVAALDLPNAFQIEQSAVGAFAKAGFDQNNFGFWKQQFDNRLIQMRNMKAQPSPADVAAAQAAAAAAKVSSSTQVAASATAPKPATT